MKITENMEIEVVKNDRSLQSRKKLTPQEESRKKGIWLTKIIDGQKVDFFIPWQRSEQGKYVDLTQTIKVARVDWEAKEVTCFLCGKQFHFESGLDNHIKNCSGNPGRFIDKAIRKELNTILLGGVSQIINRKGEFKNKGTTVIVREISNDKTNPLTKMNNQTKKEIKNKEGISRMIELKEELETLEIKYGKLI